MLINKSHGDHRDYTDAFLNEMVEWSAEPRLYTWSGEKGTMGNAEGTHSSSAHIPETH